MTRMRIPMFLSLLLVVSSSSFSVVPGGRFPPVPPGGGGTSNKRLRRTKAKAIKASVAGLPEEETASFNDTAVTSTNILLWNEVQQRHTQSSRPATDNAVASSTQLSQQDPLVPLHAFLSVMSFLSAAGDVISIKRHGGYTNMMTGNMIRLAGALTELRWNDSFKYFSLITSYMVGNWFFRVILDRHVASSSHRGTSRWRRTSTTKSPILVAPVSLLILTLGEILSNMPLLAMAGGFINAATANASGGTIVFAMTGHMSKVLTALMDYPKTKVWNKGGVTSASIKILIWFFVGAISTTMLWNYHSCVGAQKPWFVLIGLMYATILGLVGVPKKSALENEVTLFQQPLAGNFTSMMVPALS